MKNIGVDNPFKSKDVIEKIKKIKLEKYGTLCFVNTEKTKQTNLQKYGVENVFQSDDIKEKIKQTCLAKYRC